MKGSGFILLMGALLLAILACQPITIGSPTVTASPPPPPPTPIVLTVVVPALQPQAIQISLTNTNCNDEDFYLDGNLVATVRAGATVTITTMAGPHSTQACIPGTSSCGDILPLSWSYSTSHTIGREATCDQPKNVQMTLINKNCQKMDYYVDGKRLATVKAGGTTTFTTTLGYHSVYTCFAGTTHCGAPQSENYQSNSAPQVILRGSGC